jgi:hypothetical protein
MKKIVKLITISLLTFYFIFQISFPELTLAASPQTDSRLQNLKDALLKSPNFLQYTEYKMLKHKLGIQPPKERYYYDYEEYRLKPTGASPLSAEFRGEINRTGYYGFTQTIDLLTGFRAIDESLQLGSIRYEGDYQISAQRRQIEIALEIYYSDHKYYPATLEELRPKYLSQIPAGFSYKRVGNSYELKLISPPQPNIDISTIEPLSLKSHPWQEMIKGEKPKIPEIFSLVPADYFIVYFKDVGKFTEFEEAVKSLGGPFGSIYGLKEAISIKDKIFKRLQIKEIKELRELIDEAVLVSYDLDFIPHTDYALILKVKLSQLNNFVSNFVKAPSDRHGRVGDFYVIATDPSLYEKISKLDRNDSLAQAPDLAYILSVLEKDYDGFAYFSESFIKKLTSPAYRINARRRNTILNALETLQYMVFAYRDLTGKWPKSLQQIIDEGYIAPNSIANIEDYSIDEKGIVKHKIWNTIYDVTPISQIPIDFVYPTEKTFYDNFREGYQSYWREFIDPIGISILVGDQIRFHTIILPLIEESRYNWLKDIAGLEPIEFDFLKKPDRAPSIQFISEFNLDNILYAIYKSNPREFDEEYQKCVSEYYKKSYTERQKIPLQEFCKIKEKTKEEAIALLKEKLAKALDWKEKEDILGFLGNEISLAAGESIRFKMNDFSKLDLYLGIELSNTELAKKFLDHVFELIKKETGGYSYEREIGPFGLFTPESFEPIKNTYNDVEFYIIPTGFTNIYYTFLNNRFYLTVSQKTINQLIDGGKAKTVWSNQMVRLFDYLGREQNVIFLVDGSKLQSWLKDLIRDQWLSAAGESEFKRDKMYYTEALILAKTLPGYDGTITNVKDYYRHPPTQWFNAKFVTKNGNCYLTVDKEEYDIFKIETRTDYYRYGQKVEEGKTKLEDIAKKFDVEAAFAEWEAAKSLGIGLKLTDKGLDVKIAFKNPEREEFDPRVPTSLVVEKPKPKPTKISNIYYYIGGGILGLIILIGIITFVIVKKRKKY